jgi:hypothetical protein
LDLEKGKFTTESAVGAEGLRFNHGEHGENLKNFRSFDRVARRRNAAGRENGFRVEDEGSGVSGFLHGWLSSF